MRACPRPTRKRCRAERKLTWAQIWCATAFAFFLVTIASFVASAQEPTIPERAAEAETVDAGATALPRVADSAKPPSDAGVDGSVRERSAADADAGDGARLEVASPMDAALDAEPGDAAASMGDAGQEVEASGAGDEPEAIVDLTLPALPDAGPLEPAIVEGPPPDVVPVPPQERSGVVIRTILGLITLLALAYVGGHPRVHQWERTLGVSQVITAGFPFVALGLLARLPSVGVLNDRVLAELSPALRIGLGWIGFIIGFRFDAQMLQSLPRGTSQLVVARGAIGFVAIVGACALLLLGSSGITRETLTDPVFLRDALILGTAGSLTALTAPDLLAKRGGDASSVATVSRIVSLEVITGLVGLLFIAAYFRPQGEEVAWKLPGTAWLLLTLGLGVVIGVVVYAILLRRTTSSAESIVLVLGSVAFAAGLASKLRLSPVVVCFMAGVLLVNFPGHYKERVSKTLVRLERPIYLLFLVVVGALWQFDDWRGWLLMVVFVVARFFGRWLGTRVGSQGRAIELGPDAERSLVFAPMGALSIAIVVNAQMLYPGGSISWIVTAVVGGTIATEVLLQLLNRRVANSHPLVPAVASVRESGAPRPPDDEVA